MYDKNNIFAKILRGELPADKVYEDQYSLAFKDIKPQAKTHIIIIPKQECENFEKLLDLDSEFVLNFMNSLKIIIDIANPDKKDFKLLTNNGSEAGQEIFHMHFHFLIN